MKNIESIEAFVLLLGITFLSSLLIAPTAVGSQDKHPIADFYYSPSSPTTGDTIYFIDQTIISDASLIDYSWTFGDGAKSSIGTPVHSYTNPGTYTVTLTVTDNRGLTDTCIKNINVSNTPPNADFIHSTSSPSGNIIQFEDKSTDTDGEITSWRWEFGDGKSSNIQNPSHRYQESGTYTVTLSVTDDLGKTQTKSKQINVSISNPPQIVNIEAGKDQVSRRNDNLKISFQIYEKTGIKNIEKIEIWIRNENNRTENYDFWPEGNIQVIKNLSPYENFYSFIFDPEDSFSPGEATVTIRSTDIYGLENAKTVENLFRVVGGAAEVKTEEATELDRGEATLNASIDYGDYDNVDITFYYREEGEKEWKNVDWENNYLSDDFSYELTDIKSETVYEFRAGIRYGDTKNLYDNGEILSFQENLGVMLIQSELVEATRGEPTVVSLEIANLISKDIEAVRIIPPKSYKITPSVRWIGSMEIDSYLPADFRLQTEYLRDGENLSFYAIYRSGGETHKSAPLSVSVDLEEPKKDLRTRLVAIPVVIVIVIIGIYYWRRR